LGESVNEVRTVSVAAPERGYEFRWQSWTDEERSALSDHIEEGYRQAERGELIDGGQARREIQAMQEKWREGRSSKG
jgi:hypothetical protein